MSYSRMCRAISMACYRRALEDGEGHYPDCLADELMCDCAERAEAEYVERIEEARR